MSNKKKNNTETKEQPKLIISRNGQIDIEGNFPRDEMINILRKELIYQEKLEELDIEKKIKNSLKETNQK